MLLYAENLSKTFVVYKRKGFFSYQKQEVQALLNFSLQIDRPTIYGLIGPNGAGKTTFIKHCLGLVEKTSGEIRILGFDPYQKQKEFLEQISLVSGQRSNLYQNLPARESLRLSGYLYNMRGPIIEARIDYLSRLFQIEDKLDTPVRQLSLGQKMKIEIISSVLHQPRFLFMDEPTLGLDFDAQKTIRHLLKNLHQKQKVCILLTSHYMPDILDLCQKVAVITAGQKIFDGSLQELLTGQHTEKYLQTLVNELHKQ